MAQLDRRVWAAAPLVLVALVVVAVLVLGGSGSGSGDGGDEPDAGQPAASSSAPSSPATTAPTSPDDFCVAFRAFADASNAVVAAPEDPATQEALRTTGRALLDLPTPLGLSDGGEVSLEQLVAGSLAGVGEEVELDPGVQPDQAALDSYLATTCPA